MRAEPYRPSVTRTTRTPASPVPYGAAACAAVA
ncbi:hypothetical protein FHU36_000556 [Nonomuraea muscovyensis]|uniref:Uncharacterized protein n=1 Tax=Nonomuraea muscovyensis TaxID=1124761 RepID=A0A7X0BWJ2_9ACTN|nr:hypothetical protein [Nonomuraea muscovyensis]